MTSIEVIDLGFAMAGMVITSQAAKASTTRTWRAGTSKTQALNLVQGLGRTVGAWVLVRGTGCHCS